MWTGMKRKHIHHARKCPGEFKDIDGFCCHVNERQDRYRTYWEWRYFWHSGFTTIPIGRWDWWPEFIWNYWQRSFRWLWLTFEFHGGYHYEQRVEWELQTEMNRLTNMQIDGLTRGRKPDWRAGIKDE